MAQIFEKIRGHQRTLQKIRSFLESQRLAPSYILSGLPGIGKSLVARAIVQSMVCENSNIACGQCGPCLRVEKGQSEGMLEVFPENGRIKLSSAQRVNQFFSLQKVSKRRAIIVYESHLMNTQTANALLKTIEEPPENSHFLFLTSQLGTFLPTVRSRCQVISLAPLTVDELKKLFPEAPSWAVYSAQGRADLLSELVHSEEAQQRNQYIQYFLTAMDRDQALPSVKEWLGDRENTLKLLETWQQLVRDVLFCCQGLEPLIHVDQKPALMALPRLEEELWHRFFLQLGRFRSDLEYNVDRQLALETLLYEFRHSQQTI